MANLPIDMLYGRIQIVHTERWEGDVQIFGSYEIHSAHGTETRRTENTETSRLDWSAVR